MTNYCKSCGGPLRLVDIRCRYCGTPVPPDRQFTENDRKRIAFFMRMIEALLYEKKWETRHKIGLFYFLPHTFLTMGSALLIYFALGSLIITGICLALQTVLIILFYYNKFGIFEYSISNEVLYQKQIAPEIGQFLQGFGYSGAHWQAVFIELRDAEKIDYLAEAVKDPTPKPNQDRIEAFLTYLDQKRSDYRCRNGYVFDTLGVSILNYIVISTVPIYFILFSTFCVPLLWVIPAFAYLFWYPFQTFGFSFDDLFPGVMRRFEDRELVPLVSDYCKATRTSPVELLDRSREEFGILLVDIIEKAGPVKAKAEKESSNV